MSRRLHPSNRPAKPEGLSLSGVWSLSLRQTNDDWELEVIRDFGIYEGFVDDIALTFVGSLREDDVLYFEEAKPDQKSQPITKVDRAPEVNEEEEEEEEAGIICFNVLSGRYKLGDSTADLRAFFAGRPVYVTRSQWGDCGLLMSTKTEAGAARQKKVDIAEGVVARLTAEELKVLSYFGFKRYPESDYVHDYPPSADDVY